MTTDTPLSFGVSLSAVGLGSGQALREALQQAETWGYDTYHTGDHIPGDGLDPLPALTWAAAATTRMRVRTTVIAADFRNPIILAKALASIDFLSGGRLQFGVGAGWWKRDYAMIGVPFDPPSVRIRRMIEVIEIIQRYWKGDDFSFKGEFFDLQRAAAGPRPVQERLPIVIGGGGRRLLGAAGRYADIVGLNPRVQGGTISASYFAEMPRSEIVTKVGWVREAAQAAGRDPAALTLQLPIYWLAVTDTEQESSALHDKIAGSAGIPREAVPDLPFALVGTPDALRDRIRRDGEELGVTDFSLSTGHPRGFQPIGLDTLERFAKDVIAAVR